ncbi:Glycosyl transferase, group 1 [hydrothermal vent metagenome]|uniref:Glycosyl transferase, group 1 n=1 Tax=hydrothermal vent metagenome TaxID=652676 RepID=A0A3B0YRA5_9ZZZZ
MKMKKTRLRVLMVSDVYYPRINGVSTSIESFRRQLALMDIKVELVVPRYGIEDDVEGITRVRSKKVMGSPEDRMVHWREMRRVVLEQAKHCDLIHIQTPFAGHYAAKHAAKKLGIPVISTYHTLFEEYFQHYLPYVPMRILRSIVRTFSRRQCNILNAIVVPSTAMKKRLESYNVRVPLHVLPTGISMNTFTEIEAGDFRSRHGISEDRPVALFVGRVAHEKNISFLFESLQHALKNNPDILLLIAGDGPAMADLKKQLSSMNLENSVKFIGYLDNKTELPQCYAAADIFTFASCTETQGLVLLEAMAVGLPVLALSEVGTTDILRDERGCLSPENDVVEFGSEMSRLLSQPEVLMRMSTEAKKFAKEWSEDIMAGRLAALYTDVIEKAKSKRKVL